MPMMPSIPGIITVAMGKEGFFAVLELLAMHAPINFFRRLYTHYPIPTLLRGRTGQNGRNLPGKDP